MEVKPLLKEDLLAELKILKATYDDKITHVEGHDWVQDQYAKIETEVANVPQEQQNMARGTKLANLKADLLGSTY